MLGTSIEDTAASIADILAVSNPDALRLFLEHDFQVEGTSVALSIITEKIHDAVQKMGSRELQQLNELVPPYLYPDLGPDYRVGLRTLEVLRQIGEYHLQDARQNT